MNRGKRTEVLLNQWLNRWDIKAADENESEVTRVRESVLVESHRLVEVPFVDGLNRVQPAAWMVLIFRHRQHILKAKLGHGVLVGEYRLHLRRLHIEGVRVG